MRKFAKSLKDSKSHAALNGALNDQQRHPNIQRGSRRVHLWTYGVLNCTTTPCVKCPTRRQLLSVLGTPPIVDLVFGDAKYRPILQTSEERSFLPQTCGAVGHVGREIGEIRPVNRTYCPFAPGNIFWGKPCLWIGGGGKPRSCKCLLPSESPQDPPCSTNKLA